MFTGIITDLGFVRSIKFNKQYRYEISTKFKIDKIKIGASICCSGVCLTVVDKGQAKTKAGNENWFATDISKETIDKTTITEWKKGSIINLESALKYGDELGGHMVSGHVDGTAILNSTFKEGGSQRMIFEAPKTLQKLIAKKGSVALDGVSLTVNEVEKKTFGVNVIPHTLSVTTLGGLLVGTRVNLEIDMLARYVARLI